MVKMYYKDGKNHEVRLICIQCGGQNGSRRCGKRRKRYTIDGVNPGGAEPAFPNTHYDTSGHASCKVNDGDSLLLHGFPRLFSCKQTLKMFDFILD